MKSDLVRLGPREQQVAALLLEGCGNEEIAQRLHMNRRTVKAHFSRLFQRFGIRGGIKRVKLATHLYRSQLGTGDLAAIDTARTGQNVAHEPPSPRTGNVPKAWQSSSTSQEN